MGRLGGGIANLAFLDLLSRGGQAAPAKSPLAPRPQHFPAKAKAVISIFCYGGVSQVDTFDPKPELMKRQGETMTGVGNVVASMGTPGGIMPSPWKFQKHGQCGMEISELFPHLSAHADDLALIRSMNALSPAHGPAIFQMNTGTILAGAPSVGSWVTYGLGTENENLPGFIVFTDYRGGPINGAPNWGNGYMPAAYQGTQFRSSGPPIVDLKPPVERSPEEQARWLKFLRELNERHREKNPEDTELSARIYSYELAFKMQTSAAEAIDINRESEATRRLYGVDEPPTQYFGRQALMARRLIERGVRFVQLYSGGGNFEPSWDAHWDLKGNHEQHCAETDKPIAGLIKDLKSRGLFDSTLIVWHSEFGRLPISERMDGRDHNNNGFSVWLAGGGVKGGTIVGATDHYGYRAVENPKTVYDLHATILHLMGLDFEKLTYRFNGRDMRLTDVHGHLIPEILA
ncbi:MAG TPA: DUF1501 domain-containing protein [Candidatus Solibacter sp.]|nr:DUF1501 domain-containing protein [Candidatus Solibacter sp.]